MGCDIHFFAEKKYKTSYTLHRSDGPSKKVESEGYSKIGKVFKDKYFNPLRPLSDYNEILTDKPYMGRNYILFAFLAGVRNYNDINPISEPRGIPKDISSEMEEELESWGPDAHSISWLSLRELLDADWNQIVNFKTNLTPPELKLFEKTKRIPEWIKPNKNEIKDSKEVEYGVYMFELCSEFKESLNTLRQYADNEKIPYEDIRCIFFFDN